MINASLPNILITGANGQLGRMLKKHAPNHPVALSYTTHDTLDITDKAAVMRYFEKEKPDLLINTAAYTAVDLAEEATREAMNVNATGAEHLAMACQAIGIPMIHLSTDYVFPGAQERAAKEEDLTEPLNIYGKSKLLGEQAIQTYCDQHIILRVSAIYSEFGNNFYKTILRLARERKTISIVADQITTPTYAGDIAETLFTLAAKKLHWGIYHYCGRPAVSWHAFATAIIEKARQHEPLLVEEIKAITTTEFNARASRPLYSVLDCSKIARDYGISQPTWETKLWLSLSNHA